MMMGIDYRNRPRAYVFYFSRHEFDDTIMP